MSTTSATLLELSIHLSRQEVLRNLGYPRSRRPSAQVEQRLSALWDEALALLCPRGSLRIVDRETAASTGMPDPSDLVGLGLCTIGDALEQREQSLSRQQHTLQALLLDAIGSAAAEAAADALNVELCVMAGALGCGLHPRISPGYGRWPLQGQQRLLRLMEADMLGIQLTAGLMMVPRKSISFAVRLDRNLAAGKMPRRCCALCDMAHCAYRRS